MADTPSDLSILSPEEKRNLLETMLRSKQNSAPEKTHGGFQFPEEYLEMQRHFKALDMDGRGDVFFQASQGINTNLTNLDGQELVNYCSYNYLGMSGDPAVSQAAKDAIDTYGTSVSASRLVSGERPLHRVLEREIAEWVGVEDSIIFVGGFTTNENVIGHICNPGDLIVYDSLIHASIQQGAKLSGATVLPFPHNNPQALERILARRRNEFKQVLIVIEGVYSMDGDVAELPAILEIKKRHNALLMVDEAHTMGVLGATGRGLGEHHNIDPLEVDLWMGTFSKTFASCGGYIAGKSDFIDFLKLTTPGFVYSVGMSPPDAAAALAALRLLKGDPQRVTRLQDRAQLFLKLAKERGIDTGMSANSAVIPVLIGATEKAFKLHYSLRERGVLALPIAYPAVPENAARLRFFISSLHTEQQIHDTIDGLAADF